MRNFDVRWLSVTALTVVLMLAALFAFETRNAEATSKAIFVKPVTNPTHTPKPDAAVFLGVPRPTVKPSCAAGSVGLHGSTLDDCLYACTGVNRRVVSGSGCAVPTNTATATPTPTATVTP